MLLTASPIAPMMQVMQVMQVMQLRGTVMHSVYPVPVRIAGVLSTPAFASALIRN